MVGFFRMTVLWLVTVPLMACRSDFSVRTILGQKCVFASSTDCFGWREAMVQYDVETGLVYSCQPFVTVGGNDATAIRAYSLKDGFKDVWYVSDYIDNEFVSLVILDGRVFLADRREWKGPTTDNIRVVDMLDGQKIHCSQPLTGLLSCSTSCQGMLRIGHNRMLLKLLDMKSFVPSIALFDPVLQKIVRRVELADGNDGRYVWSDDYCGRFRLAVSQSLESVALQDKCGMLSFYDSDLNMKRRVAIAELLKIKNVDSGGPSDCSEISFEWVGSEVLVLWSSRTGQWWNFDAREGNVLEAGELCLRSRGTDSSEKNVVLNNKEYIQCVLGRKRFLVKGFEESVLRKEGYIVEVKSTGEEIRCPVKWGIWPRKMLTEEYFYAECWGP